MGQSRPLFVNFRSFQIQFYRKILDFSGIWIQIVSVEVEHADHLTTPHHYVKIPAQFNRKLRADYSRNSIEELIQRILASLLWGSITVRLTSCLNVQIQLLWLCWVNNRFTCSVKSKPVKQEVSHTVILPLTKCVSVLWLVDVKFTEEKLLL